MTYSKMHETSKGIQHLVDKETGQIRHAVDPLEYTLISNAQREAYLKKLARDEQKRSKNWVACYHDVITTLSSKLTLEEMGTVFLLLPYMKMNHKKGKLIDQRGKRMNTTKVAKAIGKSVPQTKRLVGTLSKEGILLKEREGRNIVFSIASEYHTIGSVTDNSYFTKVYQQFTHTLKNEYDLTIQLAGVLYSLLPYFHYDSYLLCTNPNEQDNDELDPMTENEIAEMLGIDRSTVTV